MIIVSITLIVLYFLLGEVLCKPILIRKIRRMKSPDDIKKRVHWMADKFSPAREFWKSAKAIIRECGGSLIEGLILGAYGLGCLVLRVLYLIFWPIHMIVAIFAVNKADKKNPQPMRPLFPGPSIQDDP